MNENSGVLLLEMISLVQLPINVIINIMRIPEVNTRQNLSIYKNNLENFRDFISNDSKQLNKAFFIKAK